MKIKYVVTLENGRKVEADTKAEVRKLAALSNVAEKLVDAALDSGDLEGVDLEIIGRVCLALAMNRSAVCSAYVVPRKKQK
jgi:hypothetical protein